MIVALVLFAAILVSVHERRVIVLMLVVVRAMLELADGPAHMVVRHVPVVVRVHLRLMLVLVLAVADDHLLR